MQFHDQPDTCLSIKGGVNLPQDLVALLATLKIPNALLFVGNPDLGKVETALAFARALNCQGEKRNDGLACDQCRSCKKILSSMHPDIICVAPVKERIKISQIREIYGQIKAKPHEAKFRMVLIQGAEAMNPEASNALLKILEEPPERTFFILTTERTDGLLPTILSRCRQVTFSPMDQGKIEQILVRDHGIDTTTAGIAASWSQGSLQKALKFTGIVKSDDTTDWPERRRWMITAISTLIRGANPGVALLLAEKINQNPELLGGTLAILESFFRDMVVFKYNTEKIINSDFQTLLTETDSGISTQRVLSWITELHHVEKKIKANAGIRLTLEAFLFKLIPARQLA
ncbi:HolB [Desulforapulum autotrophicum HRM2]|uniref:DNA polymerase III subunit delta' n=1 Tax=Desulforapulum autotrophicum (strain ATCC 43914 / DSM 3382 / VKM B-1955 / HRM2) TaxID=177437 RepID=C0QI37_DESAH|nr:DNA polymerase III subunit delta' [Desulforapulum autotrophicum]ACN15773.1 HolB [Desulforapulum autotrophicum HRM2]